MGLRIAIRADASVLLGSGHVRRCLALIDHFIELDCDVTVFTRAAKGNMSDMLRCRGCTVHELCVPLAINDDCDISDCSNKSEYDDAISTISNARGAIYDWMIVDHYELSGIWEEATRDLYKHLLVFDDLADRNHQCSILVDQNLGRDPSHYQGLLNTEATCLCGPRYAALRPEFPAARVESLARARNRVGLNVLIFMGGTDPNNVTSQVLQSILDGHEHVFENLYVVMGSAAPSLSKVKDLIAKFTCRTELVIDTDKIHEYMMVSDVAFGGAGGAAWERCCLGLPSLIVTIADNQLAGSRALVREGAAKVLSPSELGEAGLAYKIQQWGESRVLHDMSVKAANVCDGGGVSRILMEMCKVDKSLLAIRRAEAADESLLLSWANDPLTRKNAFNQEPISLQQHTDWFGGKMKQVATCHIYIVSLPNGDDIGQVRFEKEHHQWVIDYSMDAMFRGKGLGVSLLSRALSTLAEHHSNEQVVGHVKLSNLASTNIFIRCAFTKQSENENGTVTFVRKI